MNNPILKTLSDGDIVVLECPNVNGTQSIQICRITNVKFTPADERCGLDWLDFKRDILYTNVHLHKVDIANGIGTGGCMSITKKLGSDTEMELFAKANGLWSSSQYLLTDEELKYRLIRALKTHPSAVLHDAYKDYL